MSNPLQPPPSSKPKEESQDCLACRVVGEFFQELKTPYTPPNNYQTSKQLLTVPRHNRLHRRRHVHLVHRPRTAYPQSSRHRKERLNVRLQESHVWARRHLIRPRRPRNLSLGAVTIQFKQDYSAAVQPQYSRHQPLFSLFFVSFSVNFLQELGGLRRRRESITLKDSLLVFSSLSDSPDCDWLTVGSGFWRA